MEKIQYDIKDYTEILNNVHLGGNHFDKITIDRLEIHPELRYYISEHVKIFTELYNKHKPTIETQIQTMILWGLELGIHITQAIQRYNQALTKETS